MPEISVVMPVYNAERFLRPAIESVLAQTFTDFEFLIYDDGSTDGSVAIAREFERRDARIRVFPMTHQGYVTWLNEGLQAAKGELVARMDADDVCLPSRFARQRDYLRDHPRCVVVGSDYLSIDEDGEPLAIGRHETEHARMLDRMLAGGFGVIAHPTAMMRREAAIRVEGYRKRYEATEDLDLWLRLAEIGDLGNVPEVLLQYRHHDRSVGYAQWHRQQQWVDEIVNDARTRRAMPRLSQSIWAFAMPDAYQRHATWARWALQFGNRKAARKHARIAMRLKPWHPSGWVATAACACPQWMISVAARLQRGFRQALSR